MIAGRLRATARYRWPAGQCYPEYAKRLCSRAAAQLRGCATLANRRRTWPPPSHFSEKLGDKIQSSESGTNNGFTNHPARRYRNLRRAERRETVLATRICPTSVELPMDAPQRAVQSIGQMLRKHPRGFSRDTAASTSAQRSPSKRKKHNTSTAPAA